MNRRNADLVAACLFALAAVLVSSLFDGANIVKAMLSVPLVLFVPGYALSAAVLPDGRAGLAERVAVSLGVSIAIAVLGGLLLNFLPAGLTAGPWRFLLLGVTLAAAAFAFQRRKAEQVTGPGPLVTRVSFREAALVSSAALLIGLALGLSSLGLNPTASNAVGNTAFTQLWALPKEAGEHRVVQVGLQNYEDETVTYRVTLDAEGFIFAEWPQVTVRNGASWQAQATAPSNLSDQAIVANVYRPGDEAPYRRVRIAPAYDAAG